MVKFLSALVNSSRQPARRPAAADSVQQPDGFNPLNSIQQSQTMPREAPAMQTQRAPQPLSQPVGTMPPEPSPRHEPEAGSTTAGEIIDTSSEIQGEHNVPGLAKHPHVSEFSSGRPLEHSVCISQEPTQSSSGSGRNEPQEPQQVEMPAGTAVTQSEVEPDRGALSHEANPEQPVDPRPESAHFMRQNGQPETIVPELPEDSVMPASAAGVVTKPSADPVEVQAQPDRSASASDPGQAAADRQQPVADSPTRQPTETDLRSDQVSVQAQPAVRTRPLPRQPVQQNQTQKTPQVRIGQINVLVEDQAPANPSPRKSAGKTAAANPFGLRGL